MQAQADSPKRLLSLSQKQTNLNVKLFNVLFFNQEF